MQEHGWDTNSRGIEGRIDYSSAVQMNTITIREAGVAAVEYRAGAPSGPFGSVSGDGVRILATGAVTEFLCEHCRRSGAASVVPTPRASGAGSGTGATGEVQYTVAFGTPITFKYCIYHENDSGSLKHVPPDTTGYGKPADRRR